MQNIPLTFDPASKDQARINRELTEVIRQLWRRQETNSASFIAYNKELKDLAVLVRQTALLENVAFVNVENQFTENQLMPTARIGDASDYSEFEADGTMRFNGDATVWNDINIEAYNLGTGATAPAVGNFAGSAIRTYQFFGGIVGPSDELHGGMELLHDWKEETSVHFHVHWTPTVLVAAPNDGVVWGLEYTLQNVGGVYGAGATATVTDTLPDATPAWTHFLTDIAIIPMVGYTIGSNLLFRIFRNRVAGNTYPNNVAVISVGIHYETDTCGSRQMLNK
jgi:hypothetical protein